MTVRLSTRSRYGLRAMVSIARGAREPVTAERLAQCEDVSKKYLDRLLNKLRSGGMLSSIKGKGGGYILARPAGEIRVSDIVCTLEDGLCLVPCADDPAACAKSDTCPSRQVWIETAAVMKKALSGITLADLARWKPGAEPIRRTTPI